MRIGIIGGGPAGSYLGYCLAKKGIKSTIFDDSHPREKPCGGGISAGAIKKFGVLSEITGKSRDVNTFQIISPSGKDVFVSGEEWGKNISRLHLDRSLLEKAKKKGVRVINERVIDFQKKGGSWILETNKSDYEVDVLVGADGVRSIVREKILEPMPREHLSVGVGYFSKSMELEHDVIKFLKGKEGYIWAFPREDQVSVGIAARLEDSGGIGSILDEFIDENYPRMEILSEWGHLIPSAKSRKFFESYKCAGKDWLLIGDAAGHIDPVTGEGILYALYSASVASESIASGKIEGFNRDWKRAYGEELFKAVEMAKTFYNPILTELSIELASKSKEYSRIFYDILTSRIKYTKLEREIIKKMPKIFFEYFKETIRG